jgi:hypothetical protein
MLLLKNKWRMRHVISGLPPPFLAFTTGCCPLLFVAKLKHYWRAVVIGLAGAALANGGSHELELLQVAASRSLRHPKRLCQLLGGTGCPTGN